MMIEDFYRFEMGPEDDTAHGNGERELSHATPAVAHFLSGEGGGAAHGTGVGLGGLSEWDTMRSDSADLADDSSWEIWGDDALDTIDGEGDLEEHATVKMHQTRQTTRAGDDVELEMWKSSSLEGSKTGDPANKVFFS
eukprot:CAMPEP_0119508188 /NCGR_PEP_ID=MMETSP1344-20130328/27872_1 /TAXON_ID=236787 /ORGANISM="Florenciella parvula, Strain CCMP2471" /LENGTH=137 /DNA_ID=CAMNT_0007544903 /DNA_START=21 /DNA_END=434 /DNA_ORIENTATION=-